MKYYQIIGKNGYIPKFYYTKAEGKAVAAQHFYIDAGDKIDSIIQITKKQYNENRSTQTA